MQYLETNNPIQLISSPEFSFWVNASAGTGKTSILVKRLLGLLLNGVSPKSILCITFTKAAAVEMENRIKDKLSSWIFLDDDRLSAEIYQITNESITTDMLKAARKLFAYSLEDDYSFNILTIHSFCQQIIKKFHFELNIPSDFKVLSEMEVNEIIDKIKIALYEQMNSNNMDFIDAIDCITKFSSEYSLDTVLREIVQNKDTFAALIEKYTDQEIVNNISAALEMKYFDLDILKDEFLSNLPKKHLFDPLDQIDEKILHQISKFLAQEKHAQKDSLEEYFQIFLTAKNEMRKKLFTKKFEESYPEICSILYSEQDRVFKARNEITKIYILSLSKAALVFGRKLLEFLAQEKQQIGAIDYDDLISYTNYLLSQNESKDWILYKLDYQIDHILLDEAQDTSPDQWQVIRSLTEEFFAGDTAKTLPRSILVVGDEKQSIYSFQGADHKFFQDMNNYFQKKIHSSGKKLISISLETSYRSGAAILNFVDHLFNSLKLVDHLSVARDKIIHGCSRISDYSRVEVWPIYKESEENGDVVKLSSRIASRIKDMLDGHQIINGKIITPKSIMILVRRRDELYYDLFATLKDFNIPVAGSDRFSLLDNIAIDDLIAAANFVLTPYDDLNLASLLKSPLFNCDESFIYNLCVDRKSCLWEEIRTNPEYHDLYQKLSILLEIKFLSPYEFFYYIIYMLEAKSAFIKRLGEDVVDFLEEFLFLVLEYQKDHIKHLQNFVLWMDGSKDQVKRNVSKEDDKVQISTIHGAKGLQAQVVILADTTKIPSSNLSDFIYCDLEKIIWKLGGHHHNEYIAELNHQNNIVKYQEYIRLLYVALTRAEDYLIIVGQGEAHQKSWYKIIYDTLLSLGQEDGIGNLVYESGKSNIDIIIDKPNKFIDILPSYLKESLDQDEEVVSHLVPSQIDQNNDFIKSPLMAVKKNATYQGVVIHKILEHVNLQNIPMLNIIDYIDNIVLLYESSNDFVSSVRDHCLKVIEGYPWLFVNTSINEVRVGGEIIIEKKSHYIVGQVDKILFADDKVKFFDFKTGHNYQLSNMIINDNYCYQIAIYQLMLEEIFVKSIESSLLWTSIPAVYDVEKKVINDFIKIKGIE